MVEAYFSIIVGLVLLTFGADRFVEGAAAAANNLGISPLLVGLIVVGFATSAPEMLVASAASMNGNPSLAIGNAIGSNVANIGLVLGVTALVMPFAVHSRVLLREFPIMFICIGLSWFLCWDGYLSFFDGVILLVGLIGLLAFTTWLGINDKSDDTFGKEMEERLANSMSNLRASAWFFVGLGMLLIGSNALVDGAITVAIHFGVSDLVIGLTIVAIGTSLPELAASVASALKGEPDIALGNVIGSNMFNILGVVAVPGLLSPSPLNAAAMTRDFPVMVGFTFALLAVAAGRRGNGRINRIEGIALLSAFIAYQYLLFVTS
ncbi:MAG TPA: calcium/sodium antiporter [Gammaproteobacteria bacterium]|nr:calcium/sodium antiporter [Gammaproteobacteria bacterium]|tara:strand:- start:379 stop:1341 length:963 start_codon:yes stop_codon:yes gene_type:complete